MAKKDRLLLEADMLKNYILILYGFLMVLLGGFGALFMKIIDIGFKGSIIVGGIIIVILFKTSVIILAKKIKDFRIKLNEVNEEK